MRIETIDRIADVTAGSNSLPDLAARIRHYHAATADSLRCSVENAMCAGDALLEASCGAAWPMAAVAGRALQAE
jgi:hypothetical protein